MQKFYKRVGRLSPIAIKKASNVTNLRRIARLYIDSEDLLFDRLRKKYGLKKMFESSKARRRLLGYYLKEYFLNSSIFYDTLYYSEDRLNNASNKLSS